MSNISINRVTNANVYIDGVSKLGKAEEVTLPVVKFRTAENKPLGMFGTPRYPTGLEPMECKIKWNSMYPDVMKKASNPYAAVKLQIRFSIETYEGGSRVSQTPGIVYMTAQFHELPLGNWKAQENVELESTLSVTYFKLEIAGEEITEVDIEANIHKSNGVDLLADTRSHLGI